MVVFDKQGMYEVIEGADSQIEKGYEAGKDISFRDVKNIVVASTGGSSVAGSILKQYLKDSQIPVYLSEEFIIPSFADKNTLVFAVSYTGEAEEVLSMYKDALKKGCQMITISSGGKLKELALYNKTRNILIPQNLIPRHAYAYLFFPMLRILENSGLIEPQREYVRRTIQVVRNNKFDQITENLSDKVQSKIPLIYASPRYEVVAKKWKLNFNENTEIPAFYNVFPSATHNEIAGFAKRGEEFYVLIIKSDDDDARLKKRMALAKEVIREIGVQVTEISITGDSYLTKLFSAILIGDWLSYHLAIKRGIDPTPRRIIDEIEKRLKT